MGEGRREREASADEHSFNRGLRGEARLLHFFLMADVQNPVLLVRASRCEGGRHLGNRTSLLGTSPPGPVIVAAVLTGARDSTCSLTHHSYAGATSHACGGPGCGTALRVCSCMTTGEGRGLILLPFPGSTLGHELEEVTHSSTLLFHLQDGVLILVVKSR